MPETLPLFPLSTVLLPGTSLPLHVFEPRFRQLVADLITGRLPNRRLGIVTIRPGWEPGDEVGETVEAVGCAATLKDVVSMPDGRFDIILTGSDRFRLRDVVSSPTPYLAAEVDILPDVVPSERDVSLLPLLVAASRDAHQRYREQVGAERDEPTPLTEGDPAGLSYLLAADCLLSIEDRQALLAELDPARRLRLIRRVLLREAEIIRTLRAVPMSITAIADHPGRN